MDQNKNKILIVVFIMILIIVGSFIFSNDDEQVSQNKQPILNTEHYSNELFNHIKEGKENYYWDQLRQGRRCTDCYKLNKRDCMKFSNCGLCLKDGKMECIPGDVQGPFFKEDCENWIHTNYYDRHIFGEKVTTITRPWNMFYPDYEARWPSPTSRATLFY